MIGTRVQRSTKQATRQNDAVLCTVRIGAVAVFLLSSVACSLVLPQPGSGTAVAYVYGISLYDPADPEGGGNNLTFADDDAMAVGSLLQAAGYEVTVRINSEATVEQFASDMASGAATAGPNGTTLFYYSGHGGRIPSTTDGEEPVLTDSDNELLYLYGSIDSSGLADPAAVLTDDGMGSILAATAPCRRIVILDACYSGGFVGGSAAVDRNAAEAGENMVRDALSIYLTAQRDAGPDVTPAQAITLTASHEYEESYEYDGHGMFTRYFLELRGSGDANGDRRVTISEAYAYICSRLAETWPDLQLPTITGTAVDLVLFSTDR